MGTSARGPLMPMLMLMLMPTTMVDTTDTDPTLMAMESGPTAMDTDTSARGPLMPMPLPLLMPMPTTDTTAILMPTDTAPTPVPTDTPTPTDSTTTARGPLMPMPLPPLMPMPTTDTTAMPVPTPTDTVATAMLPTDTPDTDCGNSTATQPKTSPPSNHQIKSSHNQY